MSTVKNWSNSPCINFTTTMIEISTVDRINYTYTLCHAALGVCVRKLKLQLYIYLNIYSSPKWGKSSRENRKKPVVSKILTTYKSATPTLRGFGACPQTSSFILMERLFCFTEKCHSTHNSAKPSTLRLTKAFFCFTDGSLLIFHLISLL